MREEGRSRAFVLYGYVCAKKLWVFMDEGLGVVNAGTALVYACRCMRKEHNIHGRVDYGHCDALRGIPPLILCLYLSFKNRPGSIASGRFV